MREIRLLGYAATEYGDAFASQESTLAWVSSEFFEEPGRWRFESDDGYEVAMARHRLGIADKLSGVEFLAVGHSEPDYSVSCWFLIRKDGELFEVGGSHCSCHGYEDQWEPTATSKTYLTSPMFRSHYKPAPESWRDLPSSDGKRYESTDEEWAEWCAFVESL